MDSHWPILVQCHISIPPENVRKLFVLNHIVKIQNILKLWKLRNLTIDGRRIVVFKSLAISKLIRLALVTEISTTTINLLTKIQMEFIWKGKNPKIKNSTLCNDYESGGLKNVDIFSKVVSLQCSWIKRLFDNNFHQWKFIPLYLIRQYLGKNFKFHSNLEVSHSILCKFPKFYKEIFIRWGKHLSSSAALPSTVACQFIWYNKHIQIGNKSICIISRIEIWIFLDNIFILMANWNPGNP